MPPRDEFVLQSSSDSQVISQQNLEPTSTGSAHIAFILQINIISIILLGFAAAQWFLITMKAESVPTIANFNYLGLLGILVAFVMLLLFVFFFKLLNRKRNLFYFYTFIMIEVSTTCLVRPMAKATSFNVMNASILTAIVTTASIIISLNRQTDIVKTYKHYVIWTLRYFIISSIGIVATMTIKNPQFDVTLALTLMCCISIYILVFAKALGNPEFFQTQMHRVKLYSILEYCNLISLYSLSLFFFGRLSDVGW